MDLTILFCDVDDFVIQQNQDLKLLEPKKTPRFRLSISEIMTICIAYHASGYKNFKAFYRNYVIPHLLEQFPNLVSYNRFVELKVNTILSLMAYLKSRFGTCSGINFVDSTPIQVCKPKRMSRHKTFQNIAKKGKSTIGWFFGFKAHILINENGELLAVTLTPGNVDDRTPVRKMTENISGNLYADKGYICKKLAGDLINRGLNLITAVKKNMKAKLLSMVDKILLRKRSIIETVNDQLKNISNLEHSRHRSFKNFIVNFLCSLIAYTHQDKKPSITGLERHLLITN
jgi:Transposase DDE domain